ncbi:MAG: substrate-binding domain-containing protein [Pseudomonadota bacterium]
MTPEVNRPGGGPSADLRLGPDPAVRAPTIKDVARIAGVSVTTVSHVFNETRPVAADTQARVRDAIASLGYQPSRLARALRGEPTRTLGMLVTSSNNPFFAEVIHGVEERCFERGYSLILCNTGDDRDRLNAHLATLLQKRIDGLVVMTTNDDLRFFDDLSQHRDLRLVAIDTEDLDRVPVVKDDSGLGGALAARFLVERGFRRVGALAGPLGHPRAQYRLEGFIEALAGEEPPLTLTHLLREEMSLEGGARAMRHLLSQEGPLPEALFCMNDLIAIGALHALHQAGLKVPQDISIIGYDDIEMAAYCQPPLTTLHQPSADIGRSAAEALIRQVEGREAAAGVLALPPRLVKRASVGWGAAAAGGGWA